MEASWKRESVLRKKWLVGIVALRTVEVKVASSVEQQPQRLARHGPNIPNR
jgi:hypothetical protein